MKLTTLLLFYFVPRLVMSQCSLTFDELAELVLANASEVETITVKNNFSYSPSYDNYVCDENNGENVELLTLSYTDYSSSATYVMMDKQLYSKIKTRAIELGAQFANESIDAVNGFKVFTYWLLNGNGTTEDDFIITFKSGISESIEGKWVGVVTVVQSDK